MVWEQDILMHATIPAYLIKLPTVAGLVKCTTGDPPSMVIIIIVLSHRSKTSTTDVMAVFIWTHDRKLKAGH